MEHGIDFGAFLLAFGSALIELVGVDHEQLAPRGVLPSQPRARRDGLDAGVQLDEAADLHPRRRGDHQARREEVGGEVAERLALVRPPPRPR